MPRQKGRLEDGATILAIGDVHLGTACSGVPDDILDLGVRGEDMTPAFALELAVDYAIEQEVSAVLFAGDVVESTNARFEAMQSLEHCVKRLGEAGISAIAVAGNHDVEALPRLAKMMEGFTLLGADGRWETCMVTKSGKPVAQIIGWSFPERSVRSSPLVRLQEQQRQDDLEIAPSLPRIGLLHADLDASGASNYAPIRQAELDDTGFEAWLLGHIHKPSLLDDPQAPRPSGYLGSLAGLDASETGPHGPWLVSISQANNVTIEQIPLAPLRWEHLCVAVDGLDVLEDVEDRVLEEAKAFVRELVSDVDEGWRPSAVGLRVRLTGTSPIYQDIQQWIVSGSWADMGRSVHDTAVFVNKVIDGMEAHRDLEELAKGDDPVALLAQRLLVLQGGAGEELLDDARAALREIAGKSHWKPVDEHRGAIDPLEDDALRDMLVRSGMAALDAMLENRTGGDAS